MRSLLAVLAFAGMIGFTTAADDETLRRVEIYLAPGQAAAEASTKLKALGFVPGRDAVSGELLRGRASEKALEEIARSPLVKRLAVGPVVQGDGPSKPSGYKVRLRYYIQAERTRHVQEFKRLLGDLAKAGFVKGKGLEQEEFYDEPINGTLPASGVARLRSAPYLQTALLIPDGYELPQGDKPVMVRLELNTKFGLTQQKELRAKTLAMLKKIGWRSCVGYEHHDHRQLMGWLPANQLESVILAKTTRDQNAKRDLQIEMPLPPKADPFDIDGWVIVNTEIVYKPLEFHDELLASLQSLGFEPSGEERVGLKGILRGQLPTRSIPRASRLDGVDKLTTDKEAAVERIAPILTMEVIPEPEGSEPPPEEAAPTEAAPMSKLSPELRKLIAEQGENAKPIRIEVVLRGTPSDLDDNWRESLATLRGAIGIQGRVGPLVTGVVRPADINFLAERAEVSSIRLPQASRPMVLPPFDSKKPGDLGDLPVDFVPLGRASTTPSDLASLPRRRTGQRSAVIDTDFRGYERFVGKELPKKTRLLDFSAERNQALQMEPVTGDANDLGEPGVGTRLALALMATAPAEELVLVRISPDSPYMMEQVVRCVEGRGWRSDAIALREDELKRDGGQLDEERTALRIRRRQTLNNFNEDDDTKALRDTFFKDQKAFDAKEKEFKERQARFANFIQQANVLKGVDTVLVGMLWNDGHPQPAGTQPGLRVLGLHRGEVGVPLPVASWIQAVPRKPGTSWTGLFRDANNDGAMEYVAKDAPASEQKDLTYLAWRPHSWEKTPGADKDNIVWQQLPGGTVVQVTLQWQEVHSPAWKQPKADDHYRKPLAPLQIVVLKQRDPKGSTTLPADAFDVAARSPAWVDRIENDQRTAIYEITARFQVPEGGGRYAVRIEGQAPESTQPIVGSRLPSDQKPELRPQLKLEVVDPTHRAKGRVVLQKP